MIGGIQTSDARARRTHERGKALYEVASGAEGLGLIAASFRLASSSRHAGEYSTATEPPAISPPWRGRLATLLVAGPQGYWTVP
jgi:hypothetical protein